MFRIGCHLSSAGGYLAMGQTAVSIGANVFQFFTRNPRGGAARPLDRADVRAFGAFAAEHGLGPILAHAPYTLNAAGAEERVRVFAESTMKDDLLRLEATPGALYNFHPGSHVGQGAEKGIALISSQLARVLADVRRHVPDEVLHTTVLLETMAGKGTEVGRSFEELAEIIDRVELKERMGVCLDTCHVYDAGYDIVNDLDSVVDRFDSVVGLGRLKAVHINDSKNPFCSHKDRHEKIGQGSIGLDAFSRIVNHPAFRDKPFILETPQEDMAGYAREISMLRGCVRD